MNYKKTAQSESDAAAVLSAASARDISAAETHRAYFATEHLADGMKRRTISNGMTMGVLQVALVAVNAVSLLALSRLLTPQETGLVVMVTTFTSFFRIFNDLGLSTATIQKEEITHAQVSNLFWTNLGLGGIITVAVALSSPVIAWFYKEPQLLAVTLALSTTFILTSAAVQHMALLKRQMRFRSIAYIQIVSTAIGVLVGVGMAWFKFGYWSLVGMQVATPLVAVVMSWWSCNWRPQRATRESGTRSLLNFGVNLTVSGFLWSLARGIDGILVGKFYGMESLGLYSRAISLINRPLDQAVGPLEAILVPTFSRLQTQPERYRRVVFQAFDFLALCSFPAAAIMFALGEPLTVFLLGADWVGAAPIFTWSTLFSIYVPMILVPGAMLSSQGRGKDLLRLSGFASSVTAAAFLLGAFFGPLGMIVSFSLSCLLVQMPFTYWIAGRSGPVSTKDLWVAFFKHFPLWIVVAAGTFAMRITFSGYTPFKQLLICGPVGLLTAAGFVVIYSPSRRAFLELFAIGRDWLKTRGSVIPKPA